METKHLEYQHAIQPLEQTIPHIHNTTIFLPRKQLVHNVGVECYTQSDPHGFITKDTILIPSVYQSVLLRVMHMLVPVMQISVRHCMAVLGNEDAISPLRMGIMINVVLCTTFSLLSSRRKSGSRSL